MRLYGSGGLRSGAVACVVVAAAIAALLLSTPLRAQTSPPAVALLDPLPGFAQPVFVGHAGDGSGRLFVVEQAGRVRIVKNGTLLAAPFIDITDRVLCCGERGLLGLAFPPDYATSGYFYLYYTAIAGDGDILVSRFSRGSTADQADPASEAPLLSIEHSAQSNHNGGMLAFGRQDGYLYIGTGDGGGGNDPFNNAQNPSSLLGKLLRIDVGARPAPQPLPSAAPIAKPQRRFLPLALSVRGAAAQAPANSETPVQAAQLPYVIPPSNPFVNQTGYRPEIWALGLRNPWRFSFDRQTGELYIADVGQGAWEEVSWEPAGSRGGANYGWRIVEGPDCNAFYGSSCDKARFVAPVAAYGRSEGVSVTGGYVYRGTRSQGLSGSYLFGDFGSGRIWSLRNTGGRWQRELLLDTAAGISSFGEDEAGEVYLADYGGTIYRVGTN